MKRPVVRPFVRALVAVLSVVVVPLSPAAKAPPDIRMTAPNAVGRVGAERFVTPTGQILTPAGKQVMLPGMRPQMVALSPDGKLLATAGKSNVLIIVNPSTGEILQAISLSTNRAEAKAAAKADEEKEKAGQLEHTETEVKKTNAPAPSSTQVGLTGLAFAPDGQRIYLATASGSVRAFPIGKKGFVGTPVSVPLPEVRGGKSKREIAAGIAVSADSETIYVVGNVANKLHEIAAYTGKVQRSWDTGTAPFDVVVVGDKAYVSNLGGRRAGTNFIAKAPTGRGSSVRVDPVRHIPEEGSVTVIDLAEDMVKTEIVMGPHASAMAVSPNKRYVVVCNTAADTLTVIDTRTDTVVEKIWARQTPADLFGAQPNALAFDESGKRLYVCNGTQNAVAVVAFEPEDNASKVIGLIPVGWFPGAIAHDSRNDRLCVANIKGIGVARLFKDEAPTKLSSKDYWGAVSLVPVPSTKALAAHTAVALANMRYPLLAEATLPPRPGVAARPVPERSGEPSVFKHVIYVIKENRTYDQVLGDMTEGNGDTNLCVFGEKFTPNQHKIAREFVLLDNTYCAGVQSADGHQWTDSAIANEYVERQLTAGWPRSYPGGKEEGGLDALAWSASGFIWDNAIAHKKTFRNYGEWMITEAGWRDRSKHGKTNVAWLDFWKEHNGLTTNRVRLRSRPGIESLRKHSPTNTVGWDLHVPDVMRAAFFIKELRRFETNGGFPDFSLVFLPNDHTGGTKERYPTPGAQVADNDLAFGMIVEAVSRSRFWSNTVIFAIEDDPQAGWDHVSGYRTTCYVVSPYTKRRQTISTQFNQVSVVRTMELILGLPPMNQMDATATPMTDCFTATPDYTPFASVPNRVPLDLINPKPSKIQNKALRKDAEMSARLNLDEMDKAPEDTLNRILWRAMKGPDAPYPEWAVKLVDDDDDD
jgi:DNA-binding beta-propeller fold protein YncE